MAKVVKRKKKGLKGISRSAGASGVETSPLRPKFVEKMPPCINNCPNHNKIREIVMAVSRAEELGKTYDQAMEEAWVTAAKRTGLSESTTSRGSSAISALKTILRPQNSQRRKDRRKSRS
jgi:hypothetical protein